MAKPIIKVENLSKSYMLRHEGTERYTAFRDVLTNKVRNLFSFSNSKIGSKTSDFITNPKPSFTTTEEFWALKDINFEINPGDRVGIIGRNGAGKSTLLKILSRITDPTTGKITLNGRVASLLEVGTGFHPELTGRENIYLNGAILGMSRAEIKRKFDEIVDFAEVERFLDTPVKRYSSGMYVRLAFAVAAHLEPEILIVDEVLAVGDAQFQKKCLGKMDDVSKNEGRTVLFVSHNLDSLKNLCNKGILLKSGQLEISDSLDISIERYVYSAFQSDIEYSVDKLKPSIQKLLVNEKALRAGSIEIDIYFQSPIILSQPNIGVLISNKFGSPIYASNALTHEIKSLSDMKSGYAKLTLKNFPIHTDTYNISVYLGDTHMNYDVKENAITIEFISSINLKNRQSSNTIGYLNFVPEWQYEKIN